MACSGCLMSCRSVLTLTATVVVLLLLVAHSSEARTNRRYRTRASSYRSRLQSSANSLQKDEPRGPNVCGARFRRRCCTGWQRPTSGSLCIVPQCIAGCGNGQCIRPNLCLCTNSRRTAPSCEDDDQCKGGCLNGGRCIGRDRCACPYGYTGKNCEQDFRTGPCFTQVSEGICRGQLTGVVCTKTLCCSTIGAAWGRPCEQCPTTPHPCRRGYIPNPSAKTCQDVNECHAIPGLCVGGECVNTLGSYRCECRDGQTQNPVTKVCEDINECTVSRDVCRNGVCINTEGSYFCNCNKGFEPSDDKSRCIAAQAGFCYTRIAGSGICEGRIDERMAFTDCCCTSINGKGWSLAGTTCQPCPTQGSDAHGRLCSGTSEPYNYTDLCKDFENLCKNGKCTVKPEGGFKCECSEGFRNDSKGDCVDVDECRKSGQCRNGECRNTEGGFECLCNDGFVLSKDGTYCTDMNECMSANPMCPNGRCINMDGSYKCICNAGFKQSPNQQVCTDIDECTENGRVCYNGRCVNTEGSFRCECNPGFQLSPDGAFCLDYDECKRTGMCTNGRCKNMMGSFKCICNPGYMLSSSGEVCIDTDECETQPDICTNGMCINNQGSFRCNCPRGFVVGPDGRSCTDMRKGLCYPNVRGNRCLNPLGRAVSMSECCCSFTSPGQNYAWGHDCQMCPRMEDPEFRDLCPNGKGTDMNGRDINECHQRPDICVNGNCENLQRTYRCVCNKGFKNDHTGLRCLDINECEENRRLCDGGTCRNTPGSFQCICPAGMQFNFRSQSCEDINECETDPCLGGNCVNVKGSFRCECPRGRILDTTGRICIDNRQGSCWLNIINGDCENNLPGLLTQSECCGSVGKAWGSPCTPCPSQMELHCEKGYTFKNGVNCVDINECEKIPNLCKGGGQCVNTEGSFKCTCPYGLSLDASGTRCVDLRESSCYQDYSRMMCTKPFMGTYTRYKCCCSIGAAWGQPCAGCPAKGTDEHTALCVDGGNGNGNGGSGGGGGGSGGSGDNGIDECKTFPNLCINGRCKNTAEGFECECDSGYANDNFGTNCTDIDECRISMFDICSPGQCINEPGAFHCECGEGYKGVMMNQMCIDVDECAENKMLCRGGSCENTEGSYECVCPDGHQLGPDGVMCVDIDECSTSSSICSNGHCENFMGGYQCICNQGYMPNNLKSMCIDNNECEEDNGGCQSVCVNTPGSHTCACEAGYLLLTDGRSCVDVDECKEQPDICNGGRCDNLPGTYRCLCTGGLTPSPDQKRCLDIDECLHNKNMCLNGVCQNSPGSFVCKCENGYSVKTHLRATGCTDDNECEMETNCDGDAVCINTQGSFKCDCKPGYTGDGFTCRDINECVTDNGGCHRDAACVNTPGSFRCICDDGFTGDGYKCEDVDECLVDPGRCENGQCFNFDGGYRCECDMGFAPTEDERACTDIDECSMFRNLCVNGECENVFGMFRCICDQGYKLDQSGGNCTDIDECDNPDNCQFGTCVNQQGTYVCQCPPNFESNPTGTGCVDKRTGGCYMDVPLYNTGREGICNDKIADDVSRAGCCCSVGRGWGEVQGFCEPCPVNGTSDYTNLCPGGTGFKPDLVTLTLKDINECEELGLVCEGGECTNNFGSYQCICKPGFRENPFRKRCEDIDECQEDPNRCGVGRCINTEGSFQCVCPDGYILMGDGETCMDMRKGQCFRGFENITTGREEVYQPLLPLRRRRESSFVCNDPHERPFTRFQCCCLFNGQGWEFPPAPCMLCPPKQSDEWIALCQNGPITWKDVNECQINPDVCKPHGKCRDLANGFICDCFQGFQYDDRRKVCEDINECRNTPNPCMGNAQCINTVGTYQCGCPDGYRLRPDGRRCEDVNECEEQNVCSNGACMNLEGSFSCICDDGYQLSPSREVCIDINECTTQPGICRNGTCINKPGSLMCHCHDGYTRSADGHCIDIDECIDMIGICTNGRCVNMQGSFTCQCPEGYTLSSDGHHCRDLDECFELGIMCERGTCQNTEGSFICTCPEGFRLSPDKKTCLDIDECAEMGRACFVGECRNVDGGFECKCPPGFEQTPDGMVCVDVRSGTCYDGFDRGECTNPRAGSLTRSDCCCAEGPSIAWAYKNQCGLCPEKGTSEFDHLCPEGSGFMRGPDGVTKDINECKVNPGICINGICINNDGSFRCECREGFELDASGRECVDKDECSDENACGNGLCSNSNGGFECSCDPGYEPGPNGKCQDINECHTSQNKCAFRCANLQGTFRCVCPMGYKVAHDQIHCEDVDECSTPANKCRYNCKNVVGSFLCTCPSGYIQIGTDECRDINECRTKPGVCRNGQCQNTQGSYRCNCNPGYDTNADETSCVDNRQDVCYLDLPCRNSPNLAIMNKAQCCCSLSAAWGRYCERCPQVNTRAFDRLCPQGPGLTPDGKDIDECSSMPDACKNGRCLNTMGSYRCVCNKGYKTSNDGMRCIDINECRHDPSPCEFTCSNTEGSFICGCPPGYVLNMDRLTCRDLDECTTMRHDCTGRCVNTPGSFQCECPEGFRKRGSGCDDINECYEQRQLCGPHGTCQNTRGSYQCTCPRGFRRDSTGTKCIDVDECKNGKCGEGKCTNTGGSFRCECPPGFTERNDQCVDENECNGDYVCGFIAMCVNLPGSFDCECSANMDFDIDSLSCLDGNVCGGHPCLFGCSPSSGGGTYVCGCPPGYEPMGQGHCISTASSSQTHYPPGTQLPHEPGPNTEGKLPPGEFCYQCDHDFGEIPLSHPYRTKRSAVREANSLDELVEVYAGATGLVEHMKAGEGLRKRRSVPRSLKHTKFTLDNMPSSWNVSDVVVMTMMSNQTKPKTKLVKMIPALSALRHNVLYEIASGNEEGFFDMHKKKGVSSLHFTRHVEEPRVFRLEVLCKPKVSEEQIGEKLVHLDSYTLHLEIHVELAH